MEKVLPVLQKWLEDYLPNVEGKKKNTIKSYKDTWRLMMHYYLQDGISPDDITFDSLTYHKVLGFLKWIEDTRNCKTSTRNGRLSAVSSFASYSLKVDFDAVHTFYDAIQKIPVKAVNDAEERAYFNHEEIKVLLDCPTPKDNMGMRDHVLLSYMYATGERSEEVCVTKVKDIRFLQDGKASVLIHGKGGKTRRIKIGEKPASIIKKYIQHRRIANQPEVFVFHSQRNDRMSLSCVEAVYKKYLRIARERSPSLFREKTYTPHSMRHTTAMHMLEAGVPLIVIKQFLGHKNIETTEIYAKMSPSAFNSKISNWDSKYWNEYIDEPFIESNIYDSDGIPEFLH